MKIFIIFVFFNLLDVAAFPTGEPGHGQAEGMPAEFSAGPKAQLGQNQKGESGSVPLPGIPVQPGQQQEFPVPKGRPSGAVGPAGFSFAKHTGKEKDEWSIIEQLWLRHPGFGLFLLLMISCVPCFIDLFRCLRNRQLRARLNRQFARKKIIYLPTEVWVEIFCFPWTTRRKMTQMVDKIGNRWFGEQLQFYLHEWGKHTLGTLYFRQQGIMNCPNGVQFEPLEYPQTTMPENIRYHKCFEIIHFDNRAFNFFRRIQSLLTADTKLHIRYIGEEHMDNTRTILRHLLPLIDGVHTIVTNDWMLPMLKTSMREKFNKVNVLDVKLTRFVHTDVQPIMEWLTSSHGPKLLQLFSSELFGEIDQQVLETMRQQFMEATKPSTFAVIIFYNAKLFDFNYENDIGEQLCGKRKEYWKFEVFRHQANNAKAGDQLRQWVAGNADSGALDGDWKKCIGMNAFLPCLIWMVLTMKRRRKMKRSQAHPAEMAHLQMNEGDAKSMIWMN